MNDITVLVGSYKELALDPAKYRAYEANIKTFSDHNPGIEVITVLNEIEDKYTAWACCDLKLYKWFLENKKVNKSKRYLLVEWDCWCDCNLKEHFNKVWDADVVASSIIYPERSKDWIWFKQVKDLPEEARPFATGIVPFNGTLVSRRAMEVLSNEALKPEFIKAFCELRVGTIAAMHGLDPIPNPSCTRINSFQGISPLDSKYKGLHHPRKAL